MRMMKELEHISYEKRLESRAIQPGESSKGLIDGCKYLRGWYKEDRTSGAR